MKHLIGLNKYIILKNSYMIHIIKYILFRNMLLINCNPINNKKNLFQYPLIFNKYAKYISQSFLRVLKLW